MFWTNEYMNRFSPKLARKCLARFCSYICCVSGRTASTEISSLPRVQLWAVLRKAKSSFFCFYQKSHFSNSFIFSKILFIYFLEKGKKGEREREKHQCVVASHMTPAGDLAHNPGMCPDWRLNWWPFGLQVSTQPSEPHQPGLLLLFQILIAVII